MEDQPQNREWNRISLAYVRAAKINASDQKRLYNWMAAYLVAVATVTSWLIPFVASENHIPKTFWAICSFANTFYVIAYCYVSAHLIDSARFLNWLCDRAQNSTIPGADLLRWDAFSAQGGKAGTREKLNWAISHWLVFPVCTAFVTAFPCIWGAGFLNFLLGVSALLASIYGARIAHTTGLYVSNEINALKRSAKEANLP